METGAKNETAERKRKQKFNENRDKKIQEKNEMVKKIQDNAKSELLPTLQKKTAELTEYIVDLLNKKGEEKVSNIQIMSLLAQKSISEVAMLTCRVSYTPQEIMFGFNLYLDMINKINEIKKFPPTVESFCLFLGISRSSYNDWLVDADKKDVMQYIHSYLLGVLANGGLTGETKEISSMFLQKTMGKVEQQQPIVIEHKTETNIEDIQKQLQALKDKNIIEAEYEEVEK